MIKKGNFPITLILSASDVLIKLPSCAPGRDWECSPNLSRDAAVISSGVPSCAPGDDAAADAAPNLTLIE